MSGVYEAVDAGIPVLGIPLFYDQPRNIQTLVDRGMALSMKINNLTQSTLSEVINRLIKDQRYYRYKLHIATYFDINYNTLIYTYNIYSQIFILFGRCKP